MGRQVEDVREIFIDALGDSFSTASLRVLAREVVNQLHNAREMLRKADEEDEQRYNNPTPGPSLPGPSPDGPELERKLRSDLAAVCWLLDYRCLQNAQCFARHDWVAIAKTLYAATGGKPGMLHGILAAIGGNKREGEPCP